MPVLPVWSPSSMTSALSAPPRPAVSASDLLLVAAVAFVPRLFVVLATLDAPLFADMHEYHVRALQLLETGAMGDAWRGPGYPLLLALLYALPWDNVATARLANAPIGALAAVLTSVLAAPLAGRRGAIAAGLIVALYPGLILSSSYLMPEGLYTCLMLAALIVARDTTPARSLTAGVLAGLAALTRSLGLSLVPTLALAAGWPRATSPGNESQRREDQTPGRAGRLTRRLLPGVLAAATFLLPLTPWFVFTTRTSGGPMLDSSSAFNMLAGHNPRATGRLEIDDLQWMLDTYLLGYPDEATRNRWAMQHSLDWTRDNPAAWLRLAPVKVGYLWGLEGREHAWVYTSSAFGERAPQTVQAWGAALLVSFPLLALAAVIGLCRPGLLDTLTGRHLVALLIIVSGLHVASFGESRYHLPLVPALAILAVRAAAHTPRFTRRSHLMAAVLVLLLCAAWWSQAPILLEQLRVLAAPDGWRSNLPY